MTAWNRDYDQFRKRRKDDVFTEAENVLIKEIKERIKLYNVDNISRTDAYKEFYGAHSDIPWSFLAGMVSRNAGWNMTDLEGIYLPKLLSTSMRKHLFLTYERANWLIFEDAYPQLLIYERSLQLQRPQFHLLCAFSVSVFMEGEWERFWKSKDIEKLMTAQIINEQYVIQATVIEHPYFQKHVFESLIFQLQELFHFNSVIFPTLSGELYGFSVHEFVHVKKRIELGKKLARLLFHPAYYSTFTSFSDKTVHTGSRIDYEQYMGKKESDSPYLRDAFPVILHHRYENDDWFEEGMDVSTLFAPVSVKGNMEVTEWFAAKRKQIQLLASIETLF